jgi:hypothetical protein
MSPDAENTVTGENQPAPDYPALVSTWVGETIPELEAALINGTLEERLEDPAVEEVIGRALVARYRELAKEKLKHDAAFRSSWTRVFVQAFQLSLQTPKKLFPAGAIYTKKKKKKERLWSIADATPPELCVRHYQGEVNLRPDQVVAARHWGIWFEFEHDLLGRAYAAYLIRSALSRLESNISNLWNIEATFLAGFSKLSPHARWGHADFGGRFEHLMLDILNELALHSRFAPLAEDVLERTDLRVTYPSVQRKGGGRIQVSLVAKPELHQKKVEALYLGDELIFLTPFDLATFAVSPPAVPLLQNFGWSEFWASLGGMQQDVGDLAKLLHDLFVDSLLFPPSHPNGPMWLIPPPVRKLIRIFTEHHAMTTAEQVKKREETGRRSPNSAERFTSKYWKTKFVNEPPA